MDRVAVKPLKRIVAFALLGVLVAGASGCSGDERQQDEQQHIESMMSVLVQVQSNLGRIRQKEAVVVRLSSDVEGRPAKSAEQIGREINSSIRFIDSTLTASRNLVSALEDENRTSRYRIEALDRMTGQLKGDLDRKSREIGVMKGEISKLNKQISSLMSTVDVMDEVINDQEDQISKAYYIIGTAEQLVAKGILSSPGGFSRLLGAQPSLSGDFSTSSFKEVDVAEVRDLFFDQPLGRLRIITPHTKSSYELVGGNTSSLLLIRDEAEFWRKSRCLIIVLE